MTRWGEAGVPWAQISLAKFFFGYESARFLGGTSSLAVIIGASILIISRFRMRCEMIFAQLMVLGVGASMLGSGPIRTVFCGEVLFGTFFLITDWVTSPITVRGRLLFSAMTAVLVLFFWKSFAYSEAITYAVLLANAFVPFMDWYLRPKH